MSHTEYEVGIKLTTLALMSYYGFVQLVCVFPAHNLLLCWQMLSHTECEGWLMIHHVLLWSYAFCMCFSDSRCDLCTTWLANAESHRVYYSQ